MLRPAAAHPRSGARAPSGGGGAALAAPRKVGFRVAAAACSVALFAFLWAASWQGQLIYPVTVQQAAQWAPRSEAAARAVVGAPHRARTVEVVVSRFSGNLSWVPAIASLVGATKVTIYCKALPNVGNEGHTYLWHLVEHWDALPDLLLFLPDTVEYGDKLKTWRRVKRNLEAHGREIYYADDHTPVTGFKFVLNFMNEIFYGYNFPCKDHRRGGRECVYFGHTDGVNPSGRLVPAQPPDFLEWMQAHLGGTTRRQMARCGWGNRGMVVVSRAAVGSHPKAFYQNLMAQLSDDVFPMAGMFLERLWRRIFLCSAMQPGGEGRARVGAGAGPVAAVTGHGRGVSEQAPADQWLTMADDRSPFPRR